MLVKELIDILKDMNPEWEITVTRYDGHIEGNKIKTVYEVQTKVGKWASIIIEPKVREEQQQVITCNHVYTDGEKCIATVPHRHSTLRSA